MDVKEMREVAEAVSEYYSCDCDPQIGIWSCPQCEARYLAKLMLVLTCPDPLTLDAAVKVMGREPDGLLRPDWGTWDGNRVQVYICGGGIRCVVMADVYKNPTIGLFACLVTAARMGEKA